MNSTRASRHSVGLVAVRVLATAIIVGGFATACSSSKKTSGSGSPGTGSTGSTIGSTPSGSTLLVGVDSSDTAASGYSSQVPITVNIWQDWVNSHGGIAGHKVKVLEQDDRNNAALAATIVDGYISQHVLAIIDDSTVDQTWASKATSANIPVLCAASSGNGFTCSSNPDFIPVGNTVIAGVYGQEKAAQVAGAKGIGIFYCGEVAACAQALPLQKQFAAQVGIKFDQEEITAGQPNYTAQCLAAKSAGVDAIFPEELAVQVAQDCARQGYNPIYIQAQGAVYSAFKNNPIFNGGIGVIGVAPWFAVTSPGMKTFHQAFSKYNPSLDAFYSPYTVVETWAALQLFATGLANAPTNVTATDVSKGIYGLPPRFTLDGLIPPETLVQGKNHANPCFYIIGIKNKSYNLQYGDQSYCQPGVTPS
jgi:branched-chain amino acid transport system substrate-binding protein